jgi:hypothetical protein
MHLHKLWHKMTFIVIPAKCVASKATEVRECYIFRVLWYIFRVLTYQSHVTA